MRSDDELLSHIRQQAGVRRQRRQRAIAGGATAAVVLLLGVAALAAGGEDGEGVHADGPGRPTTTTTEAPTTTEAATTDSTTTSTTTATAPPTSVDTTTTTTDPAPTTTEPPIAPVSMTSLGDGITLTVTATQRRDRPREVELTIRIESPHGSGPAGFVDWDTAGDAAVLDEDYDGFGAWDANVPMDCIADVDPDTGEEIPLGPDADAGVVDATFTKTFTYPGTGPVRLRVDANTSECTDDGSYTDLELTVPVGG